MTDKSEWERYLETVIIQAGLAMPELEYRFHPTRKWRFDMAYPDEMLAIEIEGGIYGRAVRCNNCGQQVMKHTKGGRMVIVREGGRHNTGKGIEKDAEKYNEAALLGWKVLRFTSDMIQDGRAIETICKAFGKEW